MCQVENTELQLKKQSLNIIYWRLMKLYNIMEKSEKNEKLYISENSLKKLWVTQY